MLEKKIFFSNMEANDPQDGDIVDPCGMIGRSYVKLHITLMYALGFVILEKILMYFNYKPMTYNDVPGAWLVWTQGHGWSDL